MTWDYRKFSRHPVAAEKFKKRRRNTIISHHHYRIDPELGKCSCAILRIPCACPVCVHQPDKYWLTIITPSYQPRYARVEKFYYKKYLNITVIGSSWNY